MSHAFHHALPGYSPAQVLVDKCPTCEYRGKSPDIALAFMDDRVFEKAWTRATQKVLHGLGDCSAAEAKLLDFLGAVQVQLQKRGVQFGELPGTLKPIYGSEEESDDA